MRTRTKKSCSSITLGLLSLFVFSGVNSNLAHASPEVVVAGKDQKKAQAEFEPVVYDFGKIPQGAKVKYDFSVRNKGNADLMIQRVVAACGCTAAASTSSLIAPGAEAKIHVEFDSTGFSGEKLKTIRVFTNDVDQPSSMLTLKGIVEPDVDVEPARVNFGEISKGTTSSVEVSVKVRSGASTVITGLKSYSPGLIIKEIESSNQIRRFTVSLDPATPVGEVRERIIVALSGKAARSLNIPVYATVQGSASLKPSTISFGILEGREPLRRTVKLENKGLQPLSIREIKSDNSAVSTLIHPISEGKIYEIEVIVDPRLVKKDLKAALRVLTTSNEEGSLALNVYGILPPAPR